MNNLVFSSITFGPLTFGIFFAISLYIIGILCFINSSGPISGKGPFGAQDLVLLLIALELMLLALSILFVHFSFILDDNIGATLTLYIVPLAGAESAIALSILIAYYPSRGLITL